MGACAGIVNGGDVLADGHTGAALWLRNPVHLLGARRPPGGRKGAVTLPRRVLAPSRAQSVDEVIHQALIPTGTSQTILFDLEMHTLPLPHELDFPLEPLQTQLLPHELDFPLEPPCTPTLLESPARFCRSRSPRR